MGSIGGDLSGLTRDQLCRLVWDVRRENSRLKSDLLRHELLSNKYHKYCNHLLNGRPIGADVVDNEIQRDIDALRGATGCVVKIKSLSNVIKESEDNENDGHVSEAEEVLESRDKQVLDSHNTSDDSVVVMNDTNDSLIETLWRNTSETNGHNSRSNDSRRDIHSKTNSDINSKTKSSKRKHKTSGSDSKACVDNEDTDCIHVSKYFKNTSGEAMDSMKRHISEAIESVVNNSTSFDEEVDENQASVSGQAYNRRSNYRCDREGCHFEAFLNSRLKLHKMTAHSGEPEFRCSIDGCNKLFKTDLNLRQHQLGAHPMSFPDVPWIHCPHNDCFFITKSTAYSSNHKKAHKNANYKYKHKQQKSYETHERGVVLAMNPLLEIQGQTDIVLPSVADMVDLRCGWFGCEHKFSSDEDLQTHMTTHKSCVPSPEIHLWGEQLLDLSELM
ncbi:unnamed protein product [Oppiella nova]|uniref:C2H2-type domain-containing protein n=1 Tax=Oppiella nova TaxID=334625 RepID=A0A7R9MB28_9ACAR|nr:unnamed protein product [Oppiella nova]CAG2174007.1 unnamed protein product [Oppiella nova]